MGHTQGYQTEDSKLYNLIEQPVIKTNSICNSVNLLFNSSSRISINNHKREKMADTNGARRRVIDSAIFKGCCTWQSIFAAFVISLLLLFLEHMLLLPLLHQLLLLLLPPLLLPLIFFLLLPILQSCYCFNPTPDLYLLPLSYHFYPAMHPLCPCSAPAPAQTSAQTWPHLLLLCPAL